MAITYGLDLTNTSAYSTTYTGYFDSPLYVVGTNLQSRKFTELEFRFARPLRANEGIKFEYRTDLSLTFTTIGTYDYTTWGAIVSKNIITELPTDIKSCEQVQFRISLTGTTTSPQLKSIILR